MTRTAILLAAVLAALWAGPAAAGASRATPEIEAVKIGYVELTGDPRYADQGVRADIVFPDIGRPYPGAQVALEDARAIGRVVGVEFSIERFAGTSTEDLAQRIQQWIGTEDVHFVLADLPAAALTDLARRLLGRPVVLFNVSAPDDSLRGADCSSNLFHTYPSEAMLADALVQHLVAKAWTRILVLQGPTPDDLLMTAALRRAAAKFGAKIVDARTFLLSNDPRNREQTNVGLMTEGASYDVVYVADSSGEFARSVPYQTSLPRPVVGSAGLRATAWSWSWDRDAAVQLQHRFARAAPGRLMNGADWAAWVAVKAVTEGVVRSHSTAFDAVKAFVASDKLSLDTVKGNPGSFRAWDHQLRAPILLATSDAVVERTPLPQYLHQTNVLDTLGADAPETACRF